MGHIYIDAELQGAKGTKTVRALVDTGATYTVIPPELADDIGVVKTPWVDKVRLADGRTIEAERIGAHIQILDRATTVWVLVMDTQEALIGADTLESLGFKVDPTTGKIEPTKSFIARA